MSTQRKLRDWYKAAGGHRFVYKDEKSTELWKMSAAHYDSEQHIITINYIVREELLPSNRHKIASFIRPRLGSRNIVVVDKLNYHLSRVQISARCQMPSKDVMLEIEDFILNCISDSVESLSSNCISDSNPQNCAAPPS